MDSSDSSWTLPSSSHTSTSPISPSGTGSLSSEESTSSVKKKEQKRRPKPRDGSILTCGVCGDKALGYNFDAITCESCKAFFRRNASKNKGYNCSFEGNCKLDPHTRKFCSGCRLKKCFSIGMKKEWILDERQLAKRRQRVREPKETKPKPDSPGFCEVTTNYCSDELSSPSPGASSSYLKIDIDDEEYPVPLPPEIYTHLQNIEKTYTTIFDAPYDIQTKVKFEVTPEKPHDLFNLTDAFIRRLIKFGKVLPEFKELSQEDQIHILKGGIMEIFILRSAMSFDKNSEKWKYSDTEGKKQMDPRVIATALSPDMYSSHMIFVTSLLELINSDRYILLLLFVIELFSPDRPLVKNKESVTRSQEKYSNYLKVYLESIYPVRRAQSLYPKILMKLIEVRSLGEESAKLAAKLDVTKVEPLGQEMFNLK